MTQVKGEEAVAIPRPEESEAIPNATEEVEDDRDDHAGALTPQQNQRSPPVTPEIIQVLTVYDYQNTQNYHLGTKCTFFIPAWSKRRRASGTPAEAPLRDPGQEGGAPDGV